MGGLADLLMGIGNRAAEVKRRDEDRSYKEAAEGRKIANEAILDKLKDPTLPYEEQSRYARMIEKNAGLTPGTLSDMFDKGRQLFPHLEKLMSQGQKPMPPIPTMGADKGYSAGPASSMTYEPAINIQGGAFKGQQAPAMVQPNVQMQSLPQFQQLQPMPQPPVGLNPEGRAPAGFNQAGQENFAPRNEAERLQGEHHRIVQQKIANLKALGASQATIDDFVRSTADISPVVQAAMVRSGSAENVALINARARVISSGGNSGHFVTVQEPGETIPKTVFQIEKGSLAGTMLEPNTMEQAQLKPGFKKLYDHPDQLSLQTDKDGNVTVVNATKAVEGKTTKDLGPIGKPGAATGTGTYKPLYKDNIQVGWVNSKDPNDIRPMATPGTSATKPSEATQTRVDQLTKMSDELSQLHNFIKMPNVQYSIGPLAGRWTDFTRGYIDTSSEVNEVFRISQTLADMFLRYQSGAQISEPEFHRLKKLVPNPATPLSRFQSDLNGFTKELNIILKRRGLPLVGEEGIPAPPGSLRTRGQEKELKPGVIGVWDGTGWLDKKTLPGGKLPE